MPQIQHRTLPQTLEVLQKPGLEGSHPGGEVMDPLESLLQSIAQT